MKSILRSLTIHSLVLWLVATYIGGIHYNLDLKVLLLAGLALTIVDALVKPFVNILLLPFNLVTLGAFRWISSVFTLYLTTLLVPGFSVVSFQYQGLTTNFFIIPSFSLSLLGAYVLIGILVSFFVSLLFWLFNH